MIFDCSIKNTKEWNSIVNEFGEEEAYLTYVLNNGILSQDNELIDQELIDLLLKNVNIQKLVNKYRNDKLVLGYYSNASIYLSALSNSDTKFHEAFHAIFDIALTSTEKSYYTNAAEKYINENKINIELYFSYVKDNYLNLDQSLVKNYVIEEFLADKFVEFRKAKKQETFFQMLYNKLMQFVRYLLQKLKIEDLFQNINKNKFNKYYSNREFTQDKKFLTLRGKLLSREDREGLLLLNSVAKNIFGSIVAQTIYLSKLELIKNNLLKESLVNIYKESENKDARGLVKNALNNKVTVNETLTIKQLVEKALDGYKQHYYTLYKKEGLTQKEIDKNLAILKTLEAYIYTDTSKHAKQQRNLLVKEIKNYFESVGALTHLLSNKEDDIEKVLESRNETEDLDVNIEEEQIKLALSYDLDNDAKVFFQSLVKLIKDYITTITFNYADYPQVFLNKEKYVNESLNIPNIGILDYFTVYSNIIQLFKEDENIVNKLKKLYYASTLNSENDMTDVVDHIETTIFADYFFSNSNGSGILINIEKLINEDKIEHKNGGLLSDNHIDFLNAFFSALTQYFNNESVLLVKANKASSEETDQKSISVFLVNSNSKSGVYKQQQKWMFGSDNFVKKYNKNVVEQEYKKVLTEAIKVFKSYDRASSNSKNTLFEADAKGSLLKIKNDAKIIKKALNKIGFVLDIKYITMSLIYANLRDKVFILLRVYKKGNLLDNVNIDLYNNDLIKYFRAYDLKSNQVLDHKFLEKIYTNSFKIEKETNKKLFINQFSVCGKTKFKSTLKGISSGNSIFDESIKEQNGKNAKGKRKNWIQNLTYFLSIISRLRKDSNGFRNQMIDEGIRERYDTFEKYKKEDDKLVLSGEFQAIDSLDTDFVKKNWLLNNLDFINNLEYLQYTTIDGHNISGLANLNESKKTFADLDETEGVINALILVSNIEEEDYSNLNDKYKEVNKTMKVILKLLEASNTSIYVVLLYNDKITYQLIIDYLKLEYERISIIYNQSVKDGILKTLDEIKEEIGYFIDRVHKVTYKDPKNLKLYQLKGDGIVLSKAIEGYLNDLKLIDILLERAYKGVLFQQAYTNNIKEAVENSIDKFYNDFKQNVIDLLIEKNIYKVEEDDLGNLDTVVNLSFSGLLLSNFLTNLKTVLINHDINALWFNALLHGDHALQYKNDMSNMVKRAKLDNGAQKLSNTILILSYAFIDENVTVYLDGEEIDINIYNNITEINKVTYSVFKDEKITIYNLTINLNDSGDIANDSKDLMDAQVYESLIHRLKFLIGSGRSSADIAELMRAMILGKDIDLTGLFDETGNLDASKTILALYKLVAGGSKVYMKSTMILLTFDLVGVKEVKENGKVVWYLKLGKRELFNMLINMLKNGVDLIGLESAFKKMNVNTMSYNDIVDNKLIIKNTFSNSNFGVQTELVSGKEIITFFSQMGHIIDHEHVDLNADAFGVPISKWIEDFQNNEANLFLNAYVKKMADLFKYEFDLSNLFKRILLNDEHLKVNMQEFLNKTIRTLNDQEGNYKIVQILSQNIDDVLLAIDHLYVYETLLMYYYSHFNKGAYSQKINGRAFVLTSAHNFNIPKISLTVRDEKGNVKLDDQGRIIKTFKLIRSGMQLLLRLDENTGKIYYDETQLLINADLFLTKNIDKLRNFSKEHLSSFYNTETEDGEIFIDRLKYNVLRYDEKGIMIGRYTELVSSANTKQLYLLLKTSFLLDTLTGFGTRIPSQDKVSAKNLSYSDLTNLLYGDYGMVADEILYLDGGDNDGDKIFSFFLTYDSNFNEYENTYDDYRRYVREQLVSKLTATEDDIDNYLIKKNYPATREKYDEWVEAGLSLNSGYVSNQMIKSMIAMLGYDVTHNDKFTLSEDVKIVEVESKGNKLGLVEETLTNYIKESENLIVDEVVVTGILNKIFNRNTISILNYTLKAYFSFFKDGTVGANNIGLNVKNNIVFTFLYKIKAKVSDSLNLQKYLNVLYDNEVTNLSDFNKTKTLTGDSIMDTISAMISISVDEPSNKKNALLGINVEAIKFIQLLLQLGYLKEYIFLMFKLLLMNKLINKLNKKSAYNEIKKSDEKEEDLFESYISDVKGKMNKESISEINDKIEKGELLDFNLLTKVFLNDFQYLGITATLKEQYLIYKQLNNILKITDKLSSFYFNLGSILGINKGTLVDLSNLAKFDDNLRSLFKKSSLIKIGHTISAVKLLSAKNYVHLTTSFRLNAKRQQEYFFGKLSYMSSETFRNIVQTIKNNSNNYNFFLNKTNVVAQVNGFINFRFLKFNAKAVGTKLLEISLVLDILNNGDKNIVDYYYDLVDYYKEYYTKEGLEKENILIENIDQYAEDKTRTNVLIRNLVLVLTVLYDKEGKAIGENPNNKFKFNYLDFDTFTKKDRFEKKYIYDEVHTLYHLNKDKYLKVAEAISALHDYVLLQSGFNFVNNSFYEYIPLEMNKPFSTGKSYINKLFAAEKEEDYIEVINSLRLINRKLIESFNNVNLEELEKIAYKEYFGYNNKQDFILAANDIVFNNAKNNLILSLKENRQENSIEVKDEILKYKILKSKEKELEEQSEELEGINDNILELEFKQNLTKLKAKEKRYVRYNGNNYKVILNKSFELEDAYLYEYSKIKTFSLGGLAYETGLFLELTIENLKKQTDDKHDLTALREALKAKEDAKIKSVYDEYSKYSKDRIKLLHNEIDTNIREHLSYAFLDYIDDLITKSDEVLFERTLNNEELKELIDEYVEFLNNINEKQYLELKQDVEDLGLTDLVDFIEFDINELNKATRRNQALEIIYMIKNTICNK